VIEKNPSHFSANNRLAVENVSWFDAIAFGNELSPKDRLAPFFRISGWLVEVPDRNGPGYRLPTEAKRVYACRAGAATRFSVGDEENLLGEHAWYDQELRQRTPPLGLEKANPIRLVRHAQQRVGVVLGLV
jgi:formylglycine-generating enzyme required for sulfatase activity